jgi:hypothetical protein
LSNFEIFEGFFAVLLIAFEQLRIENHDIRQLLPNLDYSLGSITHRARRSSEVDPALRDLPGDVVQLVDCVQLMRRWLSLANYVEQSLDDLVRGIVRKVAIFEIMVPKR